MALLRSGSFTDWLLKQNKEKSPSRKESHHVSRWEGLPLTSVDSVCEAEDGGATLMVEGAKEDEEEKQEDSIKKNPVKVFLKVIPASMFQHDLQRYSIASTYQTINVAGHHRSVSVPETDSQNTHPKEALFHCIPLFRAMLLKMAIPHIILISILLSYVAAGSAILQRLENGTEMNLRFDKLRKLNDTFQWIVDETWRMKNQSMGYDDWHRGVYEGLLQNISVMYEKRRLSKDNMQLETAWTFPTAVLYTLTVLTACGYSTIDPLTDTGKIFAVGFALVGIPLMFITAADIGKFLSETFKKVCALWRRCNQAFLWKFCRRRMKEREKAAAAAAAANKSGDALEDLLDPEQGGGSGDPEESGLWFPISAYLFLMCLYCSIGAVLFRSYENNWGFIHAFHFAFNTVVTVGMGNIVVVDIFYLCLIVAYVIIGLAVVTMCVDLASTHLQRYFQKIHYFGRARRRFLGMSEDIREMVALIAAMRKKKGGKVTWNDLKLFLESEAGAGWDGRLSSFIPRNVHLWKYIDETSSAVSTYRHNSVNSCSSMASGAPGQRSDRDRDRDKRMARSGYHHNRHDHHRSNKSSARGQTVASATVTTLVPPDSDLAVALMADSNRKHELTPPEPRAM